MHWKPIQKDASRLLARLGDLGVETVYGVIYPPQVALVGLGEIIEQPWAEHGMLGIRPVEASVCGSLGWIRSWRRGNVRPLAQELLLQRIGRNV